MIDIPWLDPERFNFPPVEQALNEPCGLLAAGGDLSLQRLIHAYKRGIFPWYEEDQPILWWCPNPRSVIFPEQLLISRSLRKVLRKKHFNVTFDRDFEGVIRACAAPRQGSDGTWITEEMIQAYCQLHEAGFAHSVEAWHEGKLAGGLYGLALGKVFFGESMFCHQSNASKVAFVHLINQLKEQNFTLIDCQVSNPHLESLGAVEIPLSEFKTLLLKSVSEDISFFH